GTREVLVAGGDFLTAAGTPARHVAQWDGVRWAPMGFALQNGVVALTTVQSGAGDLLYAAGGSLMQEYVPPHLYLINVVGWNGTDWVAFYGMSGETYSITSFDDGTGPALYAAGRMGFQTTGTSAIVGKWNGTDWTPLGGVPYGAAR